MKNLSIKEINNKYSDAIVFITCYVEEKLCSVGTGFFVKSSGILITNYHVIDQATSIKITMTSNEEYFVKGYYIVNEDKDYAILKISGTRIPYVKLGNSDLAEIGDDIIAIGNPLGLNHSVTNGIISQIRLDNGIKFLQINAAIEKGSSGGPLFNTKGEVIGITKGGFEEGDFNFAIPINYVKGELNDLPKTVHPLPPKKLARKEDIENFDEKEKIIIDKKEKTIILNLYTKLYYSTSWRKKRILDDISKINFYKPEEWWDKNRVNNFKNFRKLKLANIKPKTKKEPTSREEFINEDVVLQYSLDSLTTYSISKINTMDNLIKYIYKKSDKIKIYLDHIEENQFDWDLCTKSSIYMFLFLLITYKWFNIDHPVLRYFNEFPDFIKILGATIILISLISKNLYKKNEIQTKQHKAIIDNKVYK